MQISRRGALLGATAAAAVTGLTVAPLAMKAAGVKAALAGDPVLPAYEAFEAVRREYIVADNHIDAIRKAVDAEMPPEPHFGRVWLDLSDAERDEGAAWRQIHANRVEAILGGDQDEIIEACYVPMRAAYNVLIGIEATTLAGLLCQIRAWAFMYESPRDSEVSKIDPKDWGDLDPELVLPRVYHDIERLAGEAPS